MTGLQKKRPGPSWRDWSGAACWGALLSGLMWPDPHGAALLATGGAFGVLFVLASGSGR